MAVLNRITVALACLALAACSVRPVHGEPIPVTLSDDAGHHVFGMVVPVPQGPAGFDGGGGAAAVGGQYPNGLYVARCDGGEVWLGGDGGGPPHCGSPGTTGAVTAVGGTSPIISSGGTTPVISSAFTAPAKGGILIDGGAWELTRCDSGAALVEGDGGGKAYVCQVPVVSASAPLAVTGSNLALSTPASGDLLIGNAGGTAYAAHLMSGDCTLSSTGVATVTQAQGGAFTFGSNGGTNYGGFLISAGTAELLLGTGALSLPTLTSTATGATVSLQSGGVLNLVTNATGAGGQIVLAPDGVVALAAASGQTEFYVGATPTEWMLATTSSIAMFGGTQATFTVGPSNDTMTGVVNLTVTDSSSRTVTLSGGSLTSTTTSQNFTINAGPGAGAASSSVVSGNLTMQTQNAVAALSGTAAGGAAGELYLYTGSGANGLGGTSGGGAGGPMLSALGNGGNAISTGTSGAGGGYLFETGMPGTAASGTTGSPGSFVVQIAGQATGGVATGAAGQFQAVSNSVGNAATFTTELDYQLVGTRNSQNNSAVRKVCNARLTGVSQTTTCTVPQIASTGIMIKYECIGRTTTAGTSGAATDTTIATENLSPTSIYQPCSTTSGGTTTCAAGAGNGIVNTGTANLASCVLTSSSNVPTVTLTTASNGAAMVVDTSIVIEALYD